MKPASRMFAVVHFCLIGFGGPAAAADDFAAGERAYKVGDYARTVELLLPLAKKGDPRAQVLVGESYMLAYGKGGLSKDTAKSRYWLEQAAKQDYTPGLRAFGNTLVGGPETMRGYRLVRTAAERGDARAQALLGYYMVNREAYRIPGDDAEALRWLHKAVEQKDTWAAWGLLFWYRGRDKVEGLRWQLVYERMSGGRLTADWSPQLEPDIRKEMTKAEIAEAWRRATTWLKDHGIEP